MIKDSKAKGVYLVTEPGCMNPSTGAFRHIMEGINQLKKNFEIKVISPEFTPPSNITKFQNKISNRKSKLKGSLVDLKRFFLNHKDIFSLYKEIKRINPDFIYERINYLDFKGLLISKILGIPHFYELNGIPHIANRNYYDSFLNKFIGKIETYFINKSNYLFIVGSWNKLIKLKHNNWLSIENGIENEYIDFFQNFNKETDGIINLVFIGHLMNKNHKPEILIEALDKVSNKEKLRLNLIGSNLEEISEIINQLNIEVKNWGFLDRKSIKEVMKLMHIGLIPGGDEYPSFMKIFEYGASKTLVIAPNLYNLTVFFSESDIFFFEKNNAESLKQNIESVISNPQLISEFGENIYYTISHKYRWEHIFNEISIRIKGVINFL